MITGAAASIFGLTFLHRSESSVLGLCSKLFDKSELISTFPWPFVDTLCYALPLSALALIVVSLLTAPPDPEHIKKCFEQK